MTKEAQTSILRDDLSLASISDMDISNCNIRLRTSRNLDKSPKLWESGKRFGLSCRGDEEEVINEYVCMEARDAGVAICPKEGNRKGKLC